MKVSDSGVLPKKYLLLAIVVILVIISYFIIRPFIAAILSALVLAYLIKPIHEYLKKSVGNAFSALISVALIILAVLIPLGLILGTLAQQILQSMRTISFSELNKIVSQAPIIGRFDINPTQIIQQAGSYLLSETTSLVTLVPSIILSIFIALIGTYYILKNWNEITTRLQNYLPVKDKTKVSKEIGEITSNIVYGYALIAAIEFIIAATSFYLLGVRFYILLPALIAIFAFIPGLGPLIIWLPTALYYLLQGNLLIFIGVTVTGLILSIGVDNLLAPKLVGQRARIHPLIMLIGIIGGIAFFGIFGFIIGPLVLVYTIKLLEETITN